MSVPQIDDELAESLRILAELEARLPAIRTQAAQLQRVYDSGRQKVFLWALSREIKMEIGSLLTRGSKAESVVQDLRWLNRGWYERSYEVVFTSKSPVSWRWRATLRTLFVIMSMGLAWMTWVAFLGVTRAHRERLLWGERLPS